MRPIEKIDDEILKVLSRSKRPVSTDELASKTDRAWHSVQKYCSLLKAGGKIEGFRVGRMNLWALNKRVGVE